MFRSSIPCEGAIRESKELGEGKGCAESLLGAVYRTYIQATKLIFDHQRLFKGQSVASERSTLVGLSSSQYADKSSVQLWTFLMEPRFLLIYAIQLILDIGEFR